VKKEWKIFLTAVMFLTRIRVPSTIDHDPAYLQKSPRYFPLIGWIVGGISVLVFLVFNKFFSENIALLASIIAGILTTGAFHEDGFADTCDGFGGGWTKEKILLIMKDSRLGTFGVIGLISILAAKFMLLKDLPKFTPVATDNTLNVFLNYRIFIGMVLTAHSLSRFMGVTVLQQYAYVTPEDSSKSKPVTTERLSALSFTVAAFFGLFPMILLPVHFLFTLIPVVAARFLLAAYFNKWIGGYTGDCLGALQQVTEIVFYLSCIIVWTYF
jgi:adenosylcobinamide-GDP ribazoletransferase